MQSESPNTSKDINVSEKEVILSESQQQVLDRLARSPEGLPKGEKMHLPIEEMTNTRFLRALAALRLSYEIALTERDGIGVITSGYLDADNVPTAELDEGGVVNIHTHIGGSFTDLCPSPGDLQICGLRRVAMAKQSTPAMIMNAGGVLVFGFDPDFRSHENEENAPGKYSWQLLKKCLYRFDELTFKVTREEMTLDEALTAFLDMLKSEGIVRLHKHWGDIRESDLSFLQIRTLSDVGDS